ncbi:MAG: O-methyltransferase [Candidatus Brocadiia bacterium]
MRWHRTASLALAGLVLAASWHPGCAEEGKKQPSEAFRKKFLEDFPRTGINTTPQDALLLRILVETGHAQRGIEVGSANGYGALNMGIGFERTGGHLYTIEIDPRRARECRANIRKMGLQESVTCVEGDALEVLPGMEGTFDFLFLDAVKSDYLKYLKAVEARLKPGAVVVADNTIRYAGAMRDFLDYIRRSPDYEMVTVRASDAKRDGMSIIYKIR